MMVLVANILLKRNEDSSLVILDLHGAGVINRMWTPTPSSDTLDFYMDGASRPSWSIRYIDLFSGLQYPFVAPLCGNQLGGYFCYLPIPFSKGCKIVFRGKKTQFHQIQYRMYAAGDQVKSFNPNLEENEKAELKKIETLWAKKTKSVIDFYSGTILHATDQPILHAGQTTTLFDLHEGGRILGIELDPGTAFEGLYKNIDIKITWDEENYLQFIALWLIFLVMPLVKQPCRVYLLAARTIKIIATYPCHLIMLQKSNLSIGLQPGTLTRLYQSIQKYITPCKKGILQMRADYMCSGIRNCFLLQVIPMYWLR